MKMIEISLRSLANEMNKLIEKKARIEKKFEKATDKVEKLDCKWTWEEHREWLLNVPTEEEARQGERNMRMAFDNVSWAGVRKSRG